MEGVWSLRPYVAELRKVDADWVMLTDSQLPINLGLLCRRRRGRVTPVRMHRGRPNYANLSHSYWEHLQ